MADSFGEIKIKCPHCGREITKDQLVSQKIQRRAEYELFLQEKNGRNEELFKLHEAGYSDKELSIKYGLSITSVSRIINKMSLRWLKKVGHKVNG